MAYKKGFFFHSDLVKIGLKCFSVLFRSHVLNIVWEVSTSCLRGNIFARKFGKDGKQNVILFGEETHKQITFDHCSLKN